MNLLRFLFVGKIVVSFDIFGGFEFGRGRRNNWWFGCNLKSRNWRFRSIWPPRMWFRMTWTWKGRFNLKFNFRVSTEMFRWWRYGKLSFVMLSPLNMVVWEFLSMSRKQFSFQWRERGERLWFREVFFSNSVLNRDLRCLWCWGYRWCKNMTAWRFWHLRSDRICEGKYLLFNLKKKLEKYCFSESFLKAFCIRVFFFFCRFLCTRMSWAQTWK